MADGTMGWLMTLCGCSVVLGALGYVTYRIGHWLREYHSRLEATIRLQAVLGDEIMLPLHGPYMATPELLYHIMHEVMVRRPQWVVELGSGISTVVIAACLKKLGQGKLVSLDHEAQFATQTQQLIQRYALQEFATVLTAPLVDTEGYQGRRSQWYDLEALRGLGLGPIDMLVVDGPPGKGQPMARFPALPQLAAYMADTARIVVDDGARSDETRMVHAWHRQVGFTDMSYQAHGKGIHLLTYQRQATATPTH